MSNDTMGGRASILQAGESRAYDAALKEGPKDFAGYFRSLLQRNPDQYWRLVGVLIGLYAKELSRGDADADPDDNEESLS
jgi:hypothetical protein